MLEQMKRVVMSMPPDTLWEGLQDKLQGSRTKLDAEAAIRVAAGHTLKTCIHDDLVSTKCKLLFVGA